MPIERRPEPWPGPQLVEARIARQQRSIKWFLMAAAVLVAAVIFLAVWLLKFGGGSPQEQPKPKPSPAASPSGQAVPLTPWLQPQRPPLYAWAKK